MSTGRATIHFLTWTELVRWAAACCTAYWVIAFGILLSGMAWAPPKAKMTTATSDTSIGAAEPAAWLEGGVMGGVAMAVGASGAVTGLIQDASGHPVPEASVRLGDRHIRTGTDGRFLFATIPTGMYIIRATGPNIAAEMHVEVRPTLNTVLLTLRADG